MGIIDGKKNVWMKMNSCVSLVPIACLVAKSHGYNFLNFPSCDNFLLTSNVTYTTKIFPIFSHLINDYWLTNFFEPIKFKVKKVGKCSVCALLNIFFKAYTSECCYKGIR